MKELIRLPVNAGSTAARVQDVTREKSGVERRGRRKNRATREEVVAEDVAGSGGKRGGGRPDGFPALPEHGLDAPGIRNHLPSRAFSNQVRKPLALTE
jgi:hypothetical protein